MNRFNNVILGQKAFIINDKKQILILKRQNSEVYNDMWDVPGGKLEEGDSLISALKREIKEECGLELTKVLTILSSSMFQGQASDKPLIFRNIYLVRAKGEVKISSEHQMSKWISVDKLQDHIFGNDNDLQAVLKGLPKAIKDIELQAAHTLLL